MDIKERFYANLQMIREDYGKRDADDAKELENIGSGKVSRKSDKKIQKMFKRDAARLRKKAVTGMDEEQLREDYDQNAATMKRVQDRQQKLFRGLTAAGHGPINTKKYAKRAKDHENEAKRYEKKAVTGMNEEQLDVKKKSDKKDKLFFRSRKMIAVSKLDRNRIRNKDNRKD